MPRARRVFFEGAVYHVYNRLARGERVFAGKAEAVVFRELLLEVVERDELTVFAWCLMPNHYHLFVRIGTVGLDRPLRSLQQRVTRFVNRGQRVYGPLWQGRYRAKMVTDEGYFQQLLAYIHLNPVSAGMVDDPARYRWSGHREILGRIKDPIVDVDVVLQLFGETRRSARAAYTRRLKSAIEEEWIGDAPGRLPWWRLGRPPRGEDEDPADAVQRRREIAERPIEERPGLSLQQFLERGCSALGVEVEDLTSRQRQPGIVRAREMLSTLGVERWGFRVVDLAQAMKKSPYTITKAITRTTQRRRKDEEFRETLEKLDREIATGRKASQPNESQ